MGRIVCFGKQPLSYAVNLKFVLEQLQHEVQQTDDIHKLTELLETFQPYLVIIYDLKGIVPAAIGPYADSLRNAGQEVLVLSNYIQRYKLEWGTLYLQPPRPPFLRNLPKEAIDQFIQLFTKTVSEIFYNPEGLRDRLYK